MGVLYPVYIGGVKCPLCNGDMLAEIQVYKPCTFDFVKDELWSIHLKCLECGFTIDISNIHGAEGLKKIVNRVFNGGDEARILKCIDGFESKCIDPVYRLISLFIDYLKIVRKTASDQEGWKGLKEHYIRLISSVIEDLSEEDVEKAIEIFRKTGERITYYMYPPGNII